MDTLQGESIRELVTSPPLKVQIALDTESTDQQVLAAVDDACRGLERHEESGQKLKWVLARILIVVRERRLWSGYQTFDDWLEARVLKRYRLGRSTVLEAISVLDTIPDAPRMKIPAANLALMARAMKATPQDQRERLKKQLLSEASMPIQEFRTEVQRRFNLRRHGKRMATIVLHVPAELASAWQKFVGDRNAAEALAQAIHFGRKPMQRSRAA